MMSRLPPQRFTEKGLSTSGRQYLLLTGGLQLRVLYRDHIRRSRGDDAKETEHDEPAANSHGKLLQPKRHFRSSSLLMPSQTALRDPTTELPTDSERKSHAGSEEFPACKLPPSQAGRWG